MKMGRSQSQHSLSSLYNTTQTRGYSKRKLSRRRHQLLLRHLIVLLLKLHRQVHCGPYARVDIAAARIARLFDRAVCTELVTDHHLHVYHVRMQLRNQLWRRGCEIPPLLWVQDDIEEAARTAVDSYLAGITMRQERAAVGVGGRGPASRWNEDTVRA